MTVATTRKLRKKVHGNTVKSRAVGLEWCSGTLSRNDKLMAEAVHET